MMPKMFCRKRIYAFKSISQFNNKSAISTWLYKITTNSAIKNIKKRKTFPVSYLAEEQGITENEYFERLKSIDSVEDEVLYNDMRETCLQMFIECLPKKQRVAFVLKVIMGLPVSEVSKILDMTESAVKTNVYRAREAIKRHMEGKCSLIHPNAPCQCALWVNYATTNGRSVKILPLHTTKRPANELSKQVSNEINYLKKLAVLYNSEIRSPSATNFINMMREIINRNRAGAYRTFQ